MRTLIVIFSLALFPLQAQDIKGVVLNKEDDTPLQQAHVFWSNTKKGTVTNAEGRFSLEKPSSFNPNTKIWFSSVGYWSRKLSYNELEKLQFRVFLTKKTENLEEVTITSKRNWKERVPFTRKKSMKRGIFSSASVMVDGKIYVFGGNEQRERDLALLAFQEVNEKGAENTNYATELMKLSNWQGYSGKLQIYDIATNSWRVSDREWRKKANHKAVNLQGKVYILGGKRLAINRAFEYLDEKIEVFDLQNNKVYTDDMNPHQAANFGAVGIGDNLFVFGGAIKVTDRGKKIYTNKAMVFNATSGLWYALPNMPKAKETNALAVGNEIYLIGGASDKILTHIELYNVVKGTWEQVGELFQPMKNPALAVNKHYIYIFNRSKLCVYDTQNRYLKEFNIGIHVNDAQMFYYKDKLYILGGDNQVDYSDYASPFVYEVDVKQLQNTRIIRSKRFDDILE